MEAQYFIQIVVCTGMVLATPYPRAPLSLFILINKTFIHMPTAKKTIAAKPKGKVLTGRGGPGRGQGRKPGVARQKAPNLQVANRIAQGIILIGENGGRLPRNATPLDVMIEAMHIAYSIGGALAAFPYAQAAAPFIHAKVSSIVLTPPAPQNPDPQGDVPMVEFYDAETKELLGLPPDDIEDATVKGEASGK
jgi:hypothetical protein